MGCMAASWPSLHPNGWRSDPAAAAAPRRWGGTWALGGTGRCGGGPPLVAKAWAGNGAIQGTLCCRRQRGVVEKAWLEHQQPAPPAGDPLPRGRQRVTNPPLRITPAAAIWTGTQHAGDHRACWHNSQPQTPPSRRYPTKWGLTNAALIKSILATSFMRHPAAKIAGSHGSGTGAAGANM